MNPLRDGSNFGSRVGAIAKCPWKTPPEPGKTCDTVKGSEILGGTRSKLAIRKSDLKQFAEWLSTTSPSVFIQNHNAWVIPTIQSIHIVGIAVVMGSVFMIYLRILGWAGMDQTLRQTTNRFGPWLTGALWLLLATGILMVIGEPVRELVTSRSG